MAGTVRGMLAEPALNLTLLAAGESLDHPIQWVHSSDLEDPTPFLEEGQMLLTVGTQFTDNSGQSDYDAYVARMTARGVVALGFGTEVVRSGTPTELVLSCASAGLTLVEVPYKTPFIALARWAADAASHDAHQREDWALTAQRAISLAALGQRGLPGVLAALGKQLDARVAVFGQDGCLDTELSPSELGTDDELLGSEALRLLRTSNRSASTISLGGEFATLQTFGPRGRLGGVLAIIGSHNDSAAQSVIITAVALIEISFEQGRIRRGSLMPLHEELLSLLIAGRADIVLRAVPSLPQQLLRVVVCRTEGQPPWFVDAIERRSSAAGTRIFLAPNDGDLVILVGDEEWRELALFLVEQEVSAGVSDLTTLSRLGPGLAQARHALARAPSPGARVVEFGTVSDSLFLGIVSGPDMVALAMARLAGLLSDDHGRKMLADTAVWLKHNGVWDSAATELGIHRHSLKKRVETVVQSLDLSIDKFGDRAQLWALLRALDFDPRDALGPRE